MKPMRVRQEGETPPVNRICSEGLGGATESGRLDFAHQLLKNTMSETARGLWRRKADMPNELRPPGEGNERNRIQRSVIITVA
jgi:hypothetical protein